MWVGENSGLVDQADRLQVERLHKESGCSLAWSYLWTANMNSSLRQQTKNKWNTETVSEVTTANAFEGETVGVENL